MMMPIFRFWPLPSGWGIVFGVGPTGFEPIDPQCECATVDFTHGCGSPYWREVLPGGFVPGDGFWCALGLFGSYPGAPQVFDGNVTLVFGDPCSLGLAGFGLGAPVAGCVFCSERFGAFFAVFVP
ncbi:hypothetical protein SAMN05660745_00508 [Corynebacterium glucuronolyticum]|nr:hypothetical protein CGLUCO_01760 [Corynebacterium glucuronolyticum DSM 44120]SMB78007.1 hypothetical protein SAMN05660745_00508 [Corynebacterium glucuronolyticum]